MKKKLLIVLFINAIGFLSIVAQEFTFNLYFEDGIGNKDTLVLGYDENATNLVDVEFGEEDIFNLKKKDNLDVFCGYNWDCQYKNVFQLYNKLIEEKRVDKLRMPNMISIFVKSKNYPLKIKWDSTLFNTEERNQSILTDVNPGCWFDCPTSGSRGFKTLYEKDTLVFDSLIPENRNQILYNGSRVDTVGVLYFAFMSVKNRSMVTSTSMVEKEEINIYPNPAQNSINVKLSVKSKAITYVIYNFLGVKVLESNISKINISDLKTGMYFLRVNYTDNRKSKFLMFTKK